MSNFAIRVENLGKRYTLNHQGSGRSQYQSLRDLVAEGVKGLGRRIVGQGAMPEEPEDFWALQGVEFEISEGDRVGIIGRNGAGKSTLLKILSRIVEPTEGKIQIRGRVASLLEVGTGFHPELTGRENIYLNGAILGMSRGEIGRKFDQMVAFAEVERFLDTPVKRYSSGMYVRLAFAVAAHLDPEILIVDEVLAVGDAQFQKKCLGKMEETEKDGRTVLFVSHSMPTVTSLCPKCILLDAGRIAQMGHTADVIMAYYSNGGSTSYSVDFTKMNRKIGDEYGQLLAASIHNSQGEPSPDVRITESFKISMQYRILLDMNVKLIPNFHFYTSDGVCAFVTSDTTSQQLPPGDYIAECHLPANFLNEGVYFVGLALSSFESGVKVHFWEKDSLSFNVRDPIENTITRNGYSGPIPGVVRPILQWNVGKSS